MQTFTQSTFPPQVHPTDSLILSVSSSADVTVRDPDSDSPALLSFSLQPQFNESLNRLSRANSDAPKKRISTPFQSHVWFQWITNPGDFFKGIQEERGPGLFTVEDFEIEAEVNNAGQLLGFVVLLRETREAFVCLSKEGRTVVRRLGLHSLAVLGFFEFHRLYFRDPDTDLVWRLDLRTFLLAQHPQLSQVISRLDTGLGPDPLANKTVAFQNPFVFEAHDLVVACSGRGVSLWCISQGREVRRIRLSSDVECADFYLTLPPADSLGTPAGRNNCRRRLHCAELLADQPESGAFERNGLFGPKRPPRVPAEHHNFLRRLL